MDIVTLGAALNGSAEYVKSHFKGGANIQIVDNSDGTQTINASGEVSSEDTVARSAIADIKDGENLDSFADVETALNDKVDKVSGKSLSTNDFTTAEKTKLDDLVEIKSIGTGLSLDSSTGELTATGGGGGGGFTPTTAQLAAMNSGIDSTKVAQIETNETNILSNKNEVDYVGSTITNTKKNGGSALYDDITALDVLIPLTFEMTGTQYESFTVAVADNNSLTNVEYYENVNPASTLYIKPHYPTTYIRCMDVSGVYIRCTYPVDINKIISGSISRQSTFIGLGKDRPNCNLSVAIGYNSESSCTGEKNTTVGVENLIDTTGVRNTSIGYHSLYRCTSGTDNAAIGAESGDDTTTGIQNTALGAYSLQRNAVGNNNTAVGFQALKGGQSSFTSDAEFNGNTVIGVRSMKNMTAGNYNTAIGYQSLTSSSNRSGCIAVGANADCTKDNQMVLGSSSITEVVFCGDKKINFNNDGTVTWEQIT